MSLALAQLNREIHSLEASLVRDKNEVVRKEKQLRKLKEKLLQINMIESAKLTKAEEREVTE